MSGLTVLLLAAGLTACVEVLAPEPPDGPFYDRTVVGATLTEGDITVRTDEWINEPIVFFPRSPREPFFTVGGGRAFRRVDGGVVRAGKEDLRRGARVRVWLTDEPGFVADRAVYVLILESP